MGAVLCCNYTLHELLTLILSVQLWNRMGHSLLARVKLQETTVIFCKYLLHKLPRCLFW